MAHSQVARQGRIHIVLLEHLQHETLSFSQWLEMRVKDQLLSSIIMDEDIVWLSQPPSQRAYTYEKMWAYGNNYCVDIGLRP
jgi:hypothetical protein